MESFLQWLWKPTLNNYTIRKLSKEEADRLKGSKSGKKHPVNVFIENLKPGENVYISRQDFTWKKRTPEVFCRRIAKRSNRQIICTDAVDGKGWVVERVG